MLCNSLPRWLPHLMALMIAAWLAACGSDGVRPRVFAPSASVQELALQPDGRWRVKLRLQNFSNVSLRIVSIDAALKIDATQAGRIAAAPDIRVPPESAEVIELEILPQADAAGRVQRVLTSRGESVNYELEGQIDSSEPSRRSDEFKFVSRLSAVPGLAQVLR